ncbi:7TM-DISM domain-containing protein [Chitinophaga sancti]|uniref:7TM diverse intracellular signaling domain-containing protein n=1 Tax=Chitinophaga sancti TaxID=1004 RepID=A0A1K1RL72_9BACT|nr:7TM-DISM domain-containing protein [Chitinophaga sancti]WQD60774.1 7TM diverse intracellular signaling domain-containing protein [Chitinophaga sancti]WQG87098.1 7TM diverse intracellular signaling domain-containing protein [Chitinophaga sancti]SFW72446.1 7TM diverse intracellular signalling [Chitinophaga sancti]
MPSGVANHFISILLLFATLGVRAQSKIHYLNNEPVLEISTDSTRIIVGNPYPNDERYRFSLTEPLNYTLYIDGKPYKAGPAVPSRQRERGEIYLTFKGNSNTSLDLQLHVTELQRYGYRVHPSIRLEKEIAAASRDHLLIISWIITITLLGCFAAYNLYTWFQLHDRVNLWYLVVQVGSMIFITSFKHFTNQLLPFSCYQLRSMPDGTVYMYNLNSLFLHIGCMIIFTGLIQLTRSYLRTKELLPIYDKVLHYLLVGYIIFELIPCIATISGWFYMDNYTLVYEDVYICILSLSILITSIVAYKKRIRAAGAFMLANTLPIVFATGLAIFFIINSAPTYSNNSSLLPEIAIISQLITFTIVLISRIKTIHEELDAKGYEIARLETDIAKSRHHHWLIEKENEQITLAIQAEKDRNEQLQQKLDTNNRELVSNSLYIHQKNKLLDDLKKQLHDIDELYPAIKSIKTSLREHKFLDAEWDKFRLHFEQVHPGFFEKLKLKHPSLTNNELRLYAYFHINLSTKEIATLLNIEAASVRQAKTRLNKKLKVNV